MNEEGRMKKYRNALRQLSFLHSPFFMLHSYFLCL